MVALTVTLAEFIRHVVLSTIIMGFGLAWVAYVRLRYQTGHRAFRRFTVTFFVLIGLVSFISRASFVSERRCRGNPQEFCRINDSTPFIAMIAITYVIVALIAARILYNER